MVEHTGKAAVWQGGVAGQEPAVGAPARLTWVLLALCLLAAGCGTADREADLIAVSDSFHAALEARDGAAACAELSADAVETLERQDKRPCPEAVLDLDLAEGARASAAEVWVTSGYADLPGADVAFFEDGPAGWKVTAAGCSPSSPGRPHDCELGG
jgi:hypothetical protein